jgi:hypothetical protein
VKKAGSIYAILLAVLLWMTALPLMAETKATNIWASVQFNKRSVVVGEPLLVTITVYTSTWFTAPPEFSEIQVAEAMMVDYQQRTGSMRKTIGLKSYPAIEKKFVVYPFRVGLNSLPALTIVVESPPEGDYKGKRRVIKSPERTFTVEAPPNGTDRQNWLSAYSVRLTEHWDRPLDWLKQGDVLERQLSIRAYGALAALIPPLEPEEGSFGNVYSKAADLNNVQNESSFTGTRTEHWTYLMEKEGKHIIPGIEVSWYDPGSGQMEYARIAERELSIAENPNMEFLISMQDSLQSMLDTGAEPAEKEPFEWMGLIWWQLSVLVLTIIVLIYILARLILRMASLAKDRRVTSLESEEWYFEKLLKAKGEEPRVLMRALLNWYDRYRGDRYGPVLGDFVCASGDNELRQSLSELEGIVYAGADPAGWSGSAFTNRLRELRKKEVRAQGPRPMEKLEPLNPEDEMPVPCAQRE